MTNKTHKAIFLDRDGTIIRDKNYLWQTKDIEYFPDTLDALLLTQKKGYQLFVVTNQSGIGRGLFNLKDMLKVNRTITEDLQKYDIQIIDWRYCPHTPEDLCQCRKPSAKMILDLIQSYSLAAEKSWMVGDKNSDLECGKNAGISSAQVYVQKSQTEYPHFVNLLEFAKSL